MDTLSIDKYQHQYINGKNVGNVAYNPPSSLFRSTLQVMITPTHFSSVLGPLYTMAEVREVVEFHQSYCKKPRIQPLNPSH